MSKIRPEDKPVLIALAKNGCSFGDELKDLAHATGYSVQRLVAVGKRYDGIQLGRFKLDYFPAQNDSFKSESPGIKNPRTGISARIPASIAITVRRKKKRS